MTVRAVDLEIPKIGKKTAVRGFGNAVCPPVARALGGAIAAAI